MQSLNLANIERTKSLGMPRNEPGAVGWGAQTQPLCFAAAKKTIILYKIYPHGCIWKKFEKQARFIKLNLATPYAAPQFHNNGAPWTFYPVQKRNLVPPATDRSHLCGVKDNDGFGDKMIREINRRDSSHPPDLWGWPIWRLVWPSAPRRPPTSCASWCSSCTCRTI